MKHTYIAVATLLACYSAMIILAETEVIPNYEMESQHRQTVICDDMLDMRLSLLKYEVGP